MDLHQGRIVRNNVFTVVGLEKSVDGGGNTVVNNNFIGVVVVAFDGDGHIESAGA